jgi:hypothetical protein
MAAIMAMAADAMQPMAVAAMAGGMGWVGMSVI